MARGLVRRAWALGLAVAAIAAIAASASGSVRINPKESRLDLLLMGFGVFQTNFAQELERFFDSSDELPPDFRNRQVLNVRLEGQLSETIEVAARVHYDRENLRDWRYLVRLGTERNEIAFGELDGAFRDTQFSRFDTPYYGIEARLGLGPLTTRAFSTTRDGNYRVDRLRGNNLSGPYILSASPVLEGSERVALEVRDRRDQEEIVRSDFQQPGLDYTLDYPTGTLRFNEPIEAETFDGNPVFVTIEYQFVDRTGGGSEALSGARLTYRPVQGITLGTTYLRSAGAGLLGVDQQIEIGRWLRVENEITGPRGDLMSRRTGAWRSEIELQPGDDFALRMRFRRVGAEFETANNPTLDTELDRQSVDLDLSFVPSPEHRLSAGFRHKSDNVAGDPAITSTRTRTWFGGWDAEMSGWPLLRLRLERRLTDGPGSFGAGESRLDTAIFDLENDVGRWPMFGPTSVRFQYRLENADETLADDLRRTHAITTRLDSRPRDGLETYVEARYTRSRGGGDSTVDSTTRELLIGGRLEMAPRLRIGSSLRWRDDTNAAFEGGDSTRTTAIVDLLYQPSDRLRASLQYEWTLLSAGASDDTHNRNLFAHLTLTPTTGLSATLGYQLDSQAARLAGGDGNSNAEYFANFLFKRDRLTLFARGERGRHSERLPPFEELASTRTTWLGGLNFELTSKWAVLAELKDERLTGAADAHRRAFVFELSRRLTTRLKLAGGVELTVDEQGDVDRLDRQRAYLKMIGIL